GTLLPEALEQTPRAVSRDVTMMAWVGQVTGLVSKALRLAGSARSAQLSLWMAIATRLAYLLGLILAMQGIVAYVLYFIIPRFEAIFRDFGISFPAVTIFAINAAHWLERYAPVSVLFILGE